MVLNDSEMAVITIRSCLEFGSDFLHCQNFDGEGLHSPRQLPLSPLGQVRNAENGFLPWDFPTITWRKKNIDMASSMIRDM